VIPAREADKQEACQKSRRDGGSIDRSVRSFLETPKSAKNTELHQERWMTKWKFDKKTATWIPAETSKNIESERNEWRECARKLQECASLLLGWHSEEMSIETVREVSEAIAEYRRIFSANVL